MKRYIVLLFVMFLSFSGISQRILRTERIFDGVKYRVECTLSETPKIIVYNSKTDYIHYNRDLTQVVHTAYVDFDPTVKITINKILSIHFLNEKHLILIVTIIGIYKYNLINGDFNTIIESEYNNDRGIKYYHKVIGCLPNSIMVQKYTLEKDDSYYGYRDDVVVGNPFIVPLN